MVSLNRSFRLGTARTSAHVTVFVGKSWVIALRHGAASLARSHRSAAKLSWKRTVSKAFLDPSECYTVDLVFFLYRRRRESRWTHARIVRRLSFSPLIATKNGEWAAFSIRDPASF